MMILVWGILGFGIYYLLKDKGVVNLKSEHKNNPEEMLKQRYVNGEIDEETYNKMIKTIRN